MSSLKTTVLLGVMSALVLAAGGFVGGRTGLFVSLGIAICLNFGSYFFSDRLALMMYSAQPVSESQQPETYARIAPIVGELAQKMNLPMPRLWLIPDPSPNAFATGRDPEHASVAVTEGLLGLMTDREIEAVIAHELGHVLHRDILISSIAATLATAITFLARMAFFFGGRRDDEDEGAGALGGLFMLILAPVAAALIQMSISRTREFSADEASAKYTGSPDSLIEALGKLERSVARVPMDATPATAHLFIMHPFSGGGLMRLFSTHPPTEERIARLRAMRQSHAAVR